MSTQPRNPRANRRDTETATETPARPGRRLVRGPQSQRDNQQQLGVNQEHKTETMRRRRRGTFP